MGKLIENIPTEVTEAVAESLRLFRQAKFGDTYDTQEASQSLPSLLERCEQFIDEDRQPRKEPVRLIHHFACTGGTLITKCLACSPNVHVLSEVDPLSTTNAEARKFNPTDLIQLVEHGNRGTSTEEKLALFRAAFGVLYDSAARKGLRMLVRDHTHSHFCTGNYIDQRPTVGEILAETYATRAIIIVRHPLDSWLSLTYNGWVNFSPGTLEEYARRYLAFLDAYSDSKIFKYEDFVTNPNEVLTATCQELDLPFPPDFQILFMAHSFSGDSGRKGQSISLRQRRAVSEHIHQEIITSTHYRYLCDLLGYNSAIQRKIR